MVGILNRLPNPFAHSPSFQDFVFAAHNSEPTDHLTIWEGQVSSLSRKYQNRDPENVVNRKAWSAFDQAIKRTFTDAKIKEICSRYCFDIDKLIESNHPLERRYVEYFGVGNATMTVQDLSELLKSRSWFFGKELRDCSVEEIAKDHARLARNSYLGDKEDPTKISGAPRGSHENFIVDLFRMDQQRCNLFQGVSELVSKEIDIPRLHRYYSRLAMAITCLLEKDKEGKNLDLIIPAPDVIEGKLDFYQVHQIISRAGLTAVALVPVSKHSTLKPIISFRCTKQALGQEDAVLSNLNNMDEHIGKSGYEACRDEFEKLMGDVNFTRGQKPIVLCYSQGGGYAGYFLKEFVTKISEFVGFNYVGSEKHVVEEIARQINELPDYEIPPRFTYYRSNGDWVNKVGEKHIGWGISHPNCIVQLIEWMVDDFPAPTDNFKNPNEIWKWFNIHGARPMDMNCDNDRILNIGKTLCDKELDTYNRDHTLEDARRLLGHKIMYRLFSTMYYLADFFLRLFGIEFFRKNMH